MPSNADVPFNEGTACDMEGVACGVEGVTCCMENTVFDTVDVVTGTEDAEVATAVFAPKEDVTVELVLLRAALSRCLTVEVCLRLKEWICSED